MEIHILSYEFPNITLSNQTCLELSLILEKVFGLIAASIWANGCVRNYLVKVDSVYANRLSHLNPRHYDKRPEHLL